MCLYLEQLDLNYYSFSLIMIYRPEICSVVLWKLNLTNSYWPTVAHHHRWIRRRRPRRDTRMFGSQNRQIGSKASEKKEERKLIETINEYSLGNVAN